MIQTDKDFRKKGSKIAIIPILTLVFSVVAPMLCLLMLIIAIVEIKRLNKFDCLIYDIKTSKLLCVWAIIISSSFLALIAVLVLVNFFVVCTALGFICVMLIFGLFARPFLESIFFSFLTSVATIIL